MYGFFGNFLNQITLRSKMEEFHSKIYLSDHCIKCEACRAFHRFFVLS